MHPDVDAVFGEIFLCGWRKIWFFLSLAAVDVGRGKDLGSIARRVALVTGRFCLIVPFRTAVETLLCGRVFFFLDFDDFGAILAFDEIDEILFALLIE